MVIPSLLKKPVNFNPMTPTPVITTLDLAEAALLACPDVGSMLPHPPVIVRLRDGTTWQLDGVYPQVDDNEMTVGFVLQVGPKDSA